jgi:hypothetical protein
MAMRHIRLTNGGESAKTWRAGPCGWRREIFGVSGIRRIVLIGAILVAGAGVANLRAQTVLGDPRDAAKTFASNCSACHKSPQGLAKSGQVAGFLRQHYTTGAEMSAAMAAYLVAAGSGPATKRGPATTTTAGGAEGPAASAKKGRKQDQLSAAHPAADGVQPIFRGKQRASKAQQEQARATPVDNAAVPADSAARPAAIAGAEEQRQAAASATAHATAASAATIEQPAAMVLDIPLPPMPDRPPPELTQSAFSSSPLP